MQYFRDMSVRAKLFGGFTVVLVLLLAVSGASLWSGQSLYKDVGRVGNGTVPRVQAADQVQIDQSTVWGFQTSYVLGEHSFRRRGFEQNLRRVRGDLTRLARYATTPTYRAALARIQAGLKRFLALDATTWRDVTLDTPASLGQAQTLTLDAEARPYAEMLAGAAAYLKQAKADQAAAMRSAAGNHSTGVLVTILLACLALLVGLGIAHFASRSVKLGVDAILVSLQSLRDNCATALKAGIEALASGDLTVDAQSVTPPIQIVSRDEIGQVAEAVGALRERLGATIAAYNQTRANLSDLVERVSGSAGQVSAASQEMAASSEASGKTSGEIANAVGDIALGAERQVQAVEQARRSAEEVGRAVSEAVTSAQQTAQFAHDARDVAQQGVNAAAQADAAMRSVSDSSEQVSDAIRQLAAKSEQIGVIVQTITGIAEQTNLLALNAAIEAARAGEQGRGFAVVAEEVRKLAEGSQVAAHEISDLIGAIQLETGRAVDVVNDGARRTRDGAAVVEQTREAFLAIDQSVEDMAGRVEQIAAVSEEIAASARSMRENIAEVAAVAQESSASTEEVSTSTEASTASAEQIAASAHELSGNAEMLSRLVSQFKLER